jgi:type II secretory pathway predicted ATPase ExeA
MYESFYGLTRTPFAVTPDPAMLFMSKVHREALATIIYGVETRKGFIVCTGEVGTGKSTIVRAFFDQTRADAVKLIYIFTPQVSPLEMAQYVCHELGLDNPDSVFAAVPRLQLKLLEEFEAGRTVVLMIDEAQLLPGETLEFLRLLSNFETDTEKLIQIVLVGQPEVDTMLARRDMRQVNQRVALRARLGPFSIEESFAYIEHRLRVSGAGALAQVMSPSVGWLIAEAAGGIPRVINILADNALIAGFGMAQRPLGSQLAGAAIREFLGQSDGGGPATKPRFAAGWRAARRLRSALARERGEPDEWVAAAPAPATSSPKAVARPREIRPPEAVVSTMPFASGAAATPGPMPTFGAPVSIAGMTIVEPVAPAAEGSIRHELPTNPSTPFRVEREGPSAKRWEGEVGAGKRSGIPHLTPALSAPQWPNGGGEGGIEQPPGHAYEMNEAALVGFAAAPTASATGPGNDASVASAVAAGAAVQWPALSRVRSGLQAAPRSGQRRF